MYLTSTYIVNNGAFYVSLSLFSIFHDVYGS